MKLNVNKVSTEGTELEKGTIAARVDLLGKVTPKQAIEDKLSKLEKTSISVDGKLVYGLVDSGTKITVVKKDLVPGILVEGASTIYLNGPGDDSEALVETEVSSGILIEKAPENFEDSQSNITSCRNEVVTVITKEEEVTAETDKGSMPKRANETTMKQPQGHLSILKSTWTGKHNNLQLGTTLVSKYLEELKSKLESAAKQAKLVSAVQPEKIAYYHNLRSSDRVFKVGNQVIMLIPDSTCKLFARWQGRVTVVQKRDPHSFLVKMPDNSTKYKHQNKQRHYIASSNSANVIFEEKRVRSC
ncbi:integrase_H2C2 domain-containing protein [Nephila pilipes]|uniref:Integrase_H2C2 domain-containing protein n=1 Tax=Nephila pilipes TaxID=299642 RepID=A0A8X6IAX5_NEPPI|nr:integrase_H2C2 domain-containing protein [Nephila pilipes]